MYGTILVVDDNADIRETTRLMLSREGYEAWLAPDAASAMQLMNQPVLACAVCAVLCDLVMPNGSGTDLIVYLRKYHPAVPIIVFSGTDDTGFLQGVLQEGVCDWMRKPVLRETLLQKVRTAVHLFTLRKQRDMDDEPVSMHPRAATSGVETFQTSEGSAT
ncbi:MAG: response regulator [Nitrospirae bacterium]|nr:response regulator [Nitrospirota bacterium]